MITWNELLMVGLAGLPDEQEARQHVTLFAEREKGLAIAAAQKYRRAGVEAIEYENERARARAVKSQEQAFQYHGKSRQLYTQDFSF